MHDLDTSLLRTFVILAETRSFTRTARRINRSQSAASMQIAKLESLLGCSLFQRDKRHVTPTPEAEKLLGYARQIVELCDSVINRFEEPDVEGEIRFGSPEDFATSYLPEILACFAQAHPKVALSVTCDLTLSLINGFEKGDYDLIVIKQEPGDLYKGAQPLWRENLVWVAGPQIDRGVSFKELSKSLSPLPLVLSPAPCVYRARAIEALNKAGVAWKINYTMPSLAGTRAVVREGLGLTVLPRHMVPKQLMPMEPERGWPKLKDSEICLLARHGQNSALKALTDFIKERISFNQKN